MDRVCIPYGYPIGKIEIKIKIKIEKEIDEKIKLKADEDERGKEHRFASACVYATKRA